MMRAQQAVITVQTHACLAPVILALRKKALPLIGVSSSRVQVTASE